MGSFQSRSPTRSEMEELKQDFVDMSEKIRSLLPWIALARHGAVVLLFCGAVFMLVALTTVFAESGIVAGALLTLTFLLHLVSFVLRECIIILRTRALLKRFHDAVPQYMDKSDVPEPRGDGPWSLILLVEVGSSVAGFLFRPDPVGETGYWLPGFIALLALELFGSLLVWKIIKDRNDLELWEGCQVCAKKLERLLGAGEDGLCAEISVHV